MKKRRNIYPWWQSGHYLISDAGSVAGERFYFRRKQVAVNAYRNDKSALFINPQPWPVYIDEIRLFSYSDTLDIALPATDLGDFAFRMSHPRYGDIFSEFMVSYALGYCDPARLQTGPGKRGGKIVLPQPFKVEAEQSLGLRVRAPATSDITGFQAGVRGLDPYNLCPVIRTNVPVAVPAAGAPVDVALVANRDKNIRAINIEDITFSITGGTDTTARNFRDIELTVVPSHGPQWTDDLATQLELVLDSVRYTQFGRSSVVFTPPAPYVLLPGEQFYIEGFVMNGGTFEQVGGQLAAVLMGHQEVPIGYYR